MFTIRYAGNSYSISTGDHRPATARDVAEIHEAIDHWFMSGQNKHYNGNRVDCPMCRQVAAGRKRVPA